MLLAVLSRWICLGELMTIPKETTLIKVYIPKTLRKQFKDICKADGIAMSAL